MKDQEVKVVESETQPVVDALKDALPQTPTVLEVEKKDGKPEKKEEKHGVKIDSKDYSWLKKNRYEEIRDKFKTTYILQHKKFPEKIVELRAASAAHACNLIHWKPQQVRLIGTKESTPDIVDTIKNAITQATSATSLV